MILKLLVVILIWRVFNSLTLSTFFQPDEFYQALEIAHEKVFGYGYVTWEFPEHLRLGIHPSVYSTAYSVLKLFGQDSRQAVLVVPKLINAVIALVSELMMYRWLKEYLADPKVAAAATLLSMASPWNWYASTRLFANGFEQMLTMCAMALWPWNKTKKTKKKHGNKPSLFWALVFAAFSCIIRPTNGLYWLPFGVGLLYRSSNKARVMIKVAAAATVAFAVSAVVDHQFYHQWTLPLVNFLKFNVVNNLLAFYGTAPWHFYIGQALPMMLMTYIPLFLLGLKQKGRSASEVSAALAVVIFGFSLIEHKEIRFLLPIEPLLMYFCAIGVVSVMKSKWFKPVMTAVVAINIGVGYFLGRVNEQGAIAIVDYLHEVPLFAILTPCHSTPWQSHFHKPDLAGWFLTCEPPLNEPLEGYEDESDRFYRDPKLWLQQNMAPNWGPTDIGDKRGWPTHIVMFEGLVPEVSEYFSEEYEECYRRWNLYFHWDGRRQGDLVVYCRKLHF